MHCLYMFTHFSFMLTKKIWGCEMVLWLGVSYTPTLLSISECKVCMNFTQNLYEIYCVWIYQETFLSLQFDQSTIRSVYILTKNAKIVRLTHIYQSLLFGDLTAVFVSCILQQTGWISWVGDFGGRGGESWYAAESSVSDHWATGQTSSHRFLHMQWHVCITWPTSTFMRISEYPQFAVSK